MNHLFYYCVLLHLRGAAAGGAPGRPAEIAAVHHDHRGEQDGKRRRRQGRGGFELHRETVQRRDTAR